MVKKSALQEIIDDMKRIIGAEISVWDEDGNVLVSTSDLDDIKSTIFDENILQIDETISEFEGVTISPVLLEGRVVCYLGLHCENIGAVVKALCEKQLENFYKLDKSELDMESFIRKLSVEKMEPLEVERIAKSNGIQVELQRALYLIQCDEDSSDLVLEFIGQMYYIETNEFLVDLGKGRILLCKEYLNDLKSNEINMQAYTLVDTIEAELMMKVLVSYGTPINNLHQLTKGYAEVVSALEIGKTFYQDRKVINYNELGVGRLVFGLSESLSETFLHEVLNGNVIEQFDEEIMNAVHKFFYNNLNISETARQLFVHRNTLVYRLGKVEKKTGLDIRLFEDALTFKMALLVSEYLRSRKETA